MFVWTTSFPLFPIRVKTADRPADREIPAPAEPPLTPAARRPAADTANE